MEKQQAKKLREQKSDREDDEGRGGEESWKEGKYDGDTSGPMFHKKVSCAQSNINLNIVNVSCLFGESHCSSLFMRDY
jgi:hypothetical protein